MFLSEKDSRFQLGRRNWIKNMKMKVGLLRWKTVVILVLMLITVLSPIFLYTDTRFSIPSSSSFILDPIRMFFLYIPHLFLEFQEPILKWELCESVICVVETGDLDTNKPHNWLVILTQITRLNYTNYQFSILILKLFVMYGLYYTSYVLFSWMLLTLYMVWFCDAADNTSIQQVSTFVSLIYFIFCY